MELNFDSIELIKVPFTIGSNEYYIQEADGEAASEFRDAKLTGMKAEADEEGNIVNRSLSFTGLNKSELVLLSHCTFKKGGIPVSYEELAKWPDKITQKLVAKVKEISELEPVGNPTRSSGQKDIAAG